MFNNLFIYIIIYLILNKVYNINLFKITKKINIWIIFNKIDFSYNIIINIFKLIPNLFF